MASGTRKRKNAVLIVHARFNYNMKLLKILFLLSVAKEKAAECGEHVLV